MNTRQLPTLHAESTFVLCPTPQTFRASGGGRPGSGTRRSRRNPSGLNRALRGREFIGQQLEAGPPHPLTNYSSRHQCNFRQTLPKAIASDPRCNPIAGRTLPIADAYSFHGNGNGAVPFLSILSRGELRSPLLQHAALRTAITMVYQLYAAR